MQQQATNEQGTNGCRPAREAGFSFIEILVVMGIIAVLTGGVLVVVQIMGKKGPQFDTQTRMQNLDALIQKFKMDTGTHPPSKVSKIGYIVGSEKKAKGENRVNEGIEALYQALTWEGIKTNYDFKEVELGNTDDDKLRKAVNKLNQAELYEILDGYGNPFVYIPSEDYVKAFEGGVPYISVNEEGEEDEPLAKPHKRSDGTGFVNPSSYQLYSMGPDGEPNTEDDIAPWKE